MDVLGLTLLLIHFASKPHNNYSCLVNPIMKKDNNQDKSSTAVIIQTVFITSS